eukprot:12880775-Prorocentrum_lima.AAC.1
MQHRYLELEGRTHRILPHHCTVRVLGAATNDLDSVLHNEERQYAGLHLGSCRSCSATLARTKECTLRSQHPIWR